MGAELLKLASVYVLRMDLEPARLSFAVMMPIFCFCSADGEAGVCCCFSVVFLGGFSSVSLPVWCGWVCFFGFVAAFFRRSCLYCSSLI